MTLKPSTSRGGASLEVTDGTTTVTGATEIDFTSGATVTASGSTAQVAISGGGGAGTVYLDVALAFAGGISTEVGTWSLRNGTYFRYYETIDVGAQNDYMQVPVWLAAGTYTIITAAGANNNRAICTFEIDGTSVGTFDMYSGTGIYIYPALTGVSVGSSGAHTVKLLSATKNPSSSGYAASYSVIQFIRTA